MSDDRCVVVIGGTTSIGLEIARHYVSTGARVVISGREEESCTEVARQLGGQTSAIAVDLAKPKGLRDQLASLGPIKYLVITPILRDQNKVDEYDIDAALNLVTMKLVGYTEVVHQLLDRLDPDSAIVLFGGLAKERPYPGSTTVTTVNGGVVGLVRTLTYELAPMRVNGIHPGVVGDSPYWQGKDVDRFVARTPIGRLVTMDEITHAVCFLLENTGVNGTNLYVDGGWTTT